MPSDKNHEITSGSQWLHEIKHDGFRIIARKTGAQVRLYSRSGNDLTRRFPLIVDALERRAQCRLRDRLIRAAISDGGSLVPGKIPNALCSFIKSPTRKEGATRLTTITAVHIDGSGRLLLSISETMWMWRQPCGS